MKRAALAAVVAVLAAVPFACDGDNPATTVGVGAGGTGDGGSAPASGPGGSGGQGSACDGDCPIQCDASPVSPSNGECVPQGGAFACNPITNEPCNDVTGEACDYAAGGFKCYAGVNEQDLCAPCGPAGPHCSAGLTCTGDGACAKMCCNDADCGSGGECAITNLDIGVGICVKGAGGPSSSSNSSSASGMGGDGGIGGMGGVGGVGGVGGGIGGAGGIGVGGAGGVI